MPVLFHARDVESVVAEVLLQDGFAVERRPDVSGTTGTDVTASKGGEMIHIEAISFKSAKEARAKDFFEVFFRAVSRLDRGATSCVIALPSRFAHGLHDRARQYRQAWPRIGEAFPELQIWIVDTEVRSIRKTKWGDWLLP